MAVPEGAVTFGGEILKGLSRQDASDSRAASVLAFILDGNEAVKRKLLAVTLNLAPHAASPPASLLSYCITALSNHIYTPGRTLVFPALQRADAAFLTAQGLNSVGYRLQQGRDLWSSILGSGQKCRCRIHAMFLLKRAPDLRLEWRTYRLASVMTFSAVCVIAAG